MQDLLENFGMELRRKRKKLHLTQKQLAFKLHMSDRTIMDIENAKIVPQLDTVVYIAQELGISLDAILFPNANSGRIPKTASDFFTGKSELEAQKYIALCQCADALHTETAEATV